MRLLGIAACLDGRLGQCCSLRRLSQVIVIAFGDDEQNSGIGRQWSHCQSTRKPGGARRCRANAAHFPNGCCRFVESLFGDKNGGDVVPAKHNDGWRTGLTAGQHFGRCLEIARHPNGSAACQSGSDSGSFVGFNHIQPGRRCEPVCKPVRQRGGKPANASLDKQMRWALVCPGELGANLFCNYPIARHDIANGRIVGILGGIGHEDSAALPGVRCRGVYSVVVGPTDPLDVSSLPFYAASASPWDGGVQVNPGGGASQTGCHGNCKAMVAVTCADQRLLATWLYRHKLFDTFPCCERQRPEAGITAT